MIIEGYCPYCNEKKELEIVSIVEKKNGAIGVIVRKITAVCSCGKIFTIKDVI